MSSPSLWLPLPTLLVWQCGVLAEVVTVGVASSADLAGDVTAGVAASANFAGYVTAGVSLSADAGVASSADLAGVVTVIVASSADRVEVVTASVVPSADPDGDVTAGVTSMEEYGERDVLSSGFALPRTDPDESSAELNTIVVSAVVTGAP